MFGFSTHSFTQCATQYVTQQSRVQSLTQRTDEQKFNDSQFNNDFLNALIKSEGTEVALAAIASLPKNWLQTHALTDHEISVVLENAETTRIQIMQLNDSRMKGFSSPNKKNLLPKVIELNNPNQPGNTWSIEDANSPQLIEIFERKVIQDPEYALRKFTSTDLTRIAILACQTYYAEKHNQFAETYPYLTIYAQSGHISPQRHDCKSVFTELKSNLVVGIGEDELSTGETQTEVGNFLPILAGENYDTSISLTQAPEETNNIPPSELIINRHLLVDIGNAGHSSGEGQLVMGNFVPMLNDLTEFSEENYDTSISLNLEPEETNKVHPHALCALSAESMEFRQIASDAVNAIEGVYVQLTKMAYEPEGWGNLAQQLSDMADTLTSHQTLIYHAIPQTYAGKDLIHCVYHELEHQKTLLFAKRDFIKDVAENDPFSEKVVAYSNLLWMHAASHMLKRASIQLHCGRTADRQFNQAIRTKIQEKTTDYANAQTNVRVPIPSKENQSTHPVLQGKKQCIAFVVEQLKSQGISDEEIAKFIDKNAVKDGWRRALNTNQEWAPHTRTILAHKNGVTRTYQSMIIPGLHISDRFHRRYVSNMPLEDGGPPHPARNGVSSAETGDHYHARNLKVSLLLRVNDDGSTTVMSTVIGHGVLDSWKIENKDEREAANIRGAHEVVEAALVTNKRIHNKVLNGEKVKLCHVSVNLTTPASWREKSVYKNTETLQDYQELTYTEAQFRAFEANSGIDIPFQIDDANGVEQTFDVDVETFTFSFAINPLATGKVPDFVGGWDNVYKHNYDQLERYIGDLGTSHITGSRVQGQRPGGFIGSVMDQIQDKTNVKALRQPEKIQELLVKLQQQTDVVRKLFLNEDFKRGNGDPAKMGREILALQTLAEEALNTIDANVGATSSKGCKSDKDRGGVTDVELKHKLITEDMGGTVKPDAILNEEDQLNYYNIAISTQFKTQQNSIGLPGSKEAYKLLKRYPDLIVRVLLTGLSGFSAE